jgi:anaerobic selenocysteine-containing dehydrogenase
LYMAVAQRLGIDQQFGEGNTVDDWIQKMFNASSLPSLISYDDFKAKGYYTFPFPTTWTRNPGLQWFYNKPSIDTPKDGVITPTGKIEFESQNLKKYFPDDKERPPVPKYVAEGPTHQESLSSAQAKQYPLLVDSPHPRYRLHSRYFNNSWMNEIPNAYILGKDGLYYESMWMHPTDAKARGIVEGDIVRIFNSRGAVHGGAHVSERIMPGVVHMSEGSSYRPAPAGKNYQDTSGAINLIFPYETVSAQAFGMVCNAILVQVEKWTGS